MAGGCSWPAQGRGRSVELGGVPAGPPMVPRSHPALGLGSPRPEVLPWCRERSRGAALGCFIAAGVRGD